MHFLISAILCVSFSNTAFASAVSELEKVAVKSAASNTSKSFASAGGKLGEMAKKFEAGDQNFQLLRKEMTLGKEIKDGTRVLGKEGIGIIDKANAKATVHFLEENGNLAEATFDLPKRTMQMGIDSMEVVSKDGKLYATAVKGIEKLPSGADLLPVYKPFSKTKMVSEEIKGETVMTTKSALVGDKDGKILRAEIDEATNEVKIQRTIGLWHGDTVFKPNISGRIVSVEPVLEANVVIVKVLDSANNLREVRHVIDSNILKPAEQAKIDAARATLGSPEVIKNALPKLAMHKEIIKGAAKTSEHQPVRGLNLTTSASAGSR
jgi:hypothetical protein